MQSRLIVKNFGPIKEVDLDLRNVNVFIGPQATGKSALAKLYTIFKAPRKFFFKNSVSKIENGKAFKEFQDVLESYNIKSFLKPNTEIFFDSELHSLSYKDEKLIYEPKLLKKIAEIELLAADFELHKGNLTKNLLVLAAKFIVFSARASAIIKNKIKDSFFLEETIQNLNNNNCAEVINVIKNIEEDLSTNTALYIPSERNFSNIIKKYALNLVFNKVPIPTHILSFGAELEKMDIKEIDLNFIQKNLAYKNIDGEDRIYTNEKHSIALGEAASGIQSVIPVLLPILTRKQLSHKSFVIEEPELNLFPIAQYELIQFLESKRRDTSFEDWGTLHTYTTHSPYILSALNNLLYANKVRNKLNSSDSMSKNYTTDSDKKNMDIIRKIVKAEIDPSSFTAYQINDGHAQSIFNRETGLIDENYIDLATDKINEDFEALMDLL